MTNTIELLTADRAMMLWPKLKPLFEQSCKSNSVGIMDISPDDILLLSQTDKAVIFVGFDSGRPATVLALQFTTTNGHKGADIIAMAGRNLLKFKSLFWKPILDWLRANDVEFVDAYGTPALAKMYTNKFGFDKSCVMVRMALTETADEQRC